MPDDTEPATHEEFQSAVPRPSQVAINVPGATVEESRVGQSGPTLAEAGERLGGNLREHTMQLVEEVGAATKASKRAAFYQVTYDVSRAINGFVFALVSVIKEVDTWPATSETQHSRTWGPWTEALSPVTLKFTITKIGPGQMMFSLQAKPKRGSDRTYVEFLGGRFVGVGGGRGFGDIFIDATAAQSIDPEGDGGIGRVDIHWDSSVEPRTVTLDLQDFADRVGDQTASALYRYSEAADTSGTFEFLVDGDINHDNDPDGLKTAKEKLGIVSRWLASGSGRSDVVVTGGDLEWPNLHAQECWDDTFARTFYADDRGIAPTEGDPAACLLPPL